MLVEEALALEDALKANGLHWVTRTGRFVPTDCGHSLTGWWRDRLVVVSEAVVPDIHSYKMFTKINSYDYYSALEV